MFPCPSSASLYLWGSSEAHGGANTSHPGWGGKGESALCLAGPSAWAQGIVRCLHTGWDALMWGQRGVTCSQHLLRGTAREAQTPSLPLATVQPEDQLLFASLQCAFSLLLLRFGGIRGFPGPWWCSGSSTGSGELGTLHLVRLVSWAPRPPPPPGRPACAPNKEPVIFVPDVLAPPQRLSLSFLI